jgi:hypothetical protein
MIERSVIFKLSTVGAGGQAGGGILPLYRNTRKKNVVPGRTPLFFSGSVRNMDDVIPATPPYQARTL